VQCRNGASAEDCRGKEKYGGTREGGVGGTGAGGGGRTGSAMKG